MSSVRLKVLHAEIERHLNEISGLFKPGMRLTFVARMPGNDEADVVLTIDDMNEVIKVLNRRNDTPRQAPGPKPPPRGWPEVG